MESGIPQLAEPDRFATLGPLGFVPWRRVGRGPIRCGSIACSGCVQDPDDVYAEHRRESDLYNIVGRRILAADHVIGKAQLDG
jgi:hypothetical protein